jgi:Family of unknown function (DUF6152)
MSSGSQRRKLSKQVRHGADILIRPEHPVAGFSLYSLVSIWQSLVQAKKEAHTSMTKIPLSWLVVVTAVLLAASSPLLAHHSVTAEFDPNQEWTATGILKKVDWINPHTATWVEVKDESGKAETWGCEGNPPATYSRAGVHREDWRVGEQVTITCLAAKDHSKHWGFLKQIKYHSDGHVLVFRLGGE